MWFMALGPIGAIESGEHRVLRGPKQRTLLAILLGHANTAVGTDTLVDALWGATPPPSAFGMVRWHIHQLRKALGDDDRIVRRGNAFSLIVGPGEFDVDRFESLVDQGRADAQAGRLAKASAEFGEALELWRGDAYEGHADGALRAEAGRLDELRTTTLQHRIDADLALGRHQELVPELTQLVIRLPLREKLRGQLMIALYRCGRSAEALDVYETGREVLADELGLDPGPELRALQQAILHGGTGIGVTVQAPSELPPDASEFVGRADETRRLEEMLRAGGIATVYGPGGAGKSTLAIHVAHRLTGEFPDGRLYVDLCGSTAGVIGPTAAEVLARFLRSLGAGHLTPEDLDELSARFRSLTSGKRILVVLDDAADVTQIRPLLPSSPGCAVLITSRRMLATLDGARHEKLGPLSDSEALTLLSTILGQERTEQDPEASQSLVGLCDRLPLAVRIAAARLTARDDWPVRKLAERLGDEHRRLDEFEIGDRALRSVFAISYDNLPADAARLFQLIGLLDISDVQVDVVAAMAGLPATEAEILLDELADAQLVSSNGPGRFVQHDLVRLYAREIANSRLLPYEKNKAIESAIHFYLGTARNATKIVQHPSPEWICLEPLELGTPGKTFETPNEVADWIISEIGNAVALAKQAATQPGNGPELAVCLAAALAWPRALASGCETYGIALSTVAVEAAQISGSPRYIAAAAYLHGTTLHSYFLEESTKWLGIAYDHWLEVGDEHGCTLARMSLAMALGALRQFDSAFELLDDCIATFQRLGYPKGETESLGHLGAVLRLAGRPSEAITVYRRCVDLDRELDDKSAEGVHLWGLGQAFLQSGDPSAAIGPLTDAVRNARGRKDLRLEAEALWNLGAAHAARAEGRLAREICTRAGEMLHSVGRISASTFSRILEHDYADGVPTDL